MTSVIMGGMKAIVRDAYGTPDVLELRDIEVPTPIGDQVLVRVRAAGVNMADVDYLLGRPPFARLLTGVRAPRNRVLGLDVAGTVEAVGSDVERFRPGDEVFGDLTEHGYGGFAEFVRAPAVAFALKPANLTFEQAATVPQAGVMAVQGLRARHRPLKAGEQVLINGAGGNIGPFAVQIAKAAGAEVTGVDRTEKLDMLRSIGADHVIDYTVEDVLDSGARYDRILDVAAHRPVRAWLRLLRPKGSYIAVPYSLSGLLDALVVGSLLSVVKRQRIGLQGGQPFDPDDVAFLVGLIEAGFVTPVIDGRYALGEVPQALRVQADGRPVGKLVVNL